MVFEGLAPGMEHAEQTDVRAEMPGVASDFEQGSELARKSRS